MTSKDWPHYNQPGGWSLGPDNIVYVEGGGKHNLTQYAQESRKYIRNRDLELSTYLSYVSAAGRRRSGNSLPLATQLESPLTEKSKSGSKTVTIMKKKGKFRRTRRRRPISASLRSRSLPFRMVVPFTTEKGLWTHGVSMKTVAVEYKKTFDEFRCTNMSIRFVPSAITAEGVYTTVLLDGPGFGSQTGDSLTWFKRLGDMPGSVLRHCAAGFQHRWKPTSPPARTWIRLNDSDYKIATLYIACNSDSVIAKGAIHITGSIRARGEFYSASGILRRYDSVNDLDALTIDDDM